MLKSKGKKTITYVGSVVSKIKTFRKIEPYKGKGIREKGQYILKKEGKKK
jgi:large subunit ribosomal protein L6